MELFFSYSMCLDVIEILMAGLTFSSRQAFIVYTNGYLMSSHKEKNLK